jgi:hypothetical protein
VVLATRPQEGAMAMVQQLLEHREHRAHSVHTLAPQAVALDLQMVGGRMPVRLEVQVERVR